MTCCTPKSVTIPTATNRPNGSRVAAAIFKPRLRITRNKLSVSPQPATPHPTPKRSDLDSGRQDRILVPYASVAAPTASGRLRASCGRERAATLDDSYGIIPRWFPGHDSDRSHGNQPTQGVNLSIDALDIVMIVDAFKGFDYPFSSPSAPGPCPGTP
jgi:hypothetical protein